MVLEKLQLLRGLFRPKADLSKEYQIGPHKILIPLEHALESYQKNYKRYDFALGEVAKIIFEKYPNSSAVDIGANVGDSAALICKYQNIPVLCVEGTPYYLNFLKKNALRIGSNIFIDECFAGEDGSLIDSNNIMKKAGTASILKAEVETFSGLGSNPIKVKSLKRILVDNPKFLQMKLLKIDTDGYDFRIIRKSINEIKVIKPVLFFEYDLHFYENAVDEAMLALRDLVAGGYKHFIVYDNFGNYLLSTDDIAIFNDLNIYLNLNKKYKQIVYYLDVCAFHTDDFDLCKKIKEIERVVAYKE